MSLHMAAFGEDLDLAGATANLAALADPILSIAGDFIRVPALNKVVALAAGLGSGGTQVISLVAPSLREIGNFVVTPHNGGADADVEPDDPPKVVDLRSMPLELRRSENMSCEAQSNTTAAAFQWLLAVLMDEMRPMPRGEVRTMRFTNTSALVARTWSNGALAAAEQLPDGEYAVVGARGVSASLIAARFVPIGGTYRPGFVGGDVQTYQDHPMFRMGGLGEWFRFRHDEIPSCDFLTDLGDSDQDIFLDLVKVG